MSMSFPFGQRPAVPGDEDHLPPVMDWQPEFSGDIDIRIDRRGEWWHDGRHVSHPRVMRQLSKLLRRETDGDFYLVTPQEKWRIRVEDQPFLIVDAIYQEAEHSPAVWWLTTNAGDRLCLDSSHRLEADDGGAPPTVEVRFGLRARLNSSVFMALLDRAEVRLVAGGEEMGLFSAAGWQPLGRLET